MAWDKAKSAPEHIRKEGFWAALCYKEHRPWAPGEREQLDRNAKALKEKLIAEFPVLKVTPRPVPDEENGFLLLQQCSFAGTSLENGGVPEELQKLIYDSSLWSRENVGRLFVEHAGLVAQIERIGALTTRSSSIAPGDFESYCNSSRAGKYCADILLLKARLSAENGGESEALRLVAAAGNIGGHLREVETPTLYGETMTLLIDLGRNGTAFETLLPILGKKADLPRWKAVLGSRGYSTADFANVLRGEWSFTADYLSLPVFLTTQRDGELPDAEAVARDHAAWCSDCVSRLPSVALADLRSCTKVPSGSGLSKEGKSLLEELGSGLDSWLNGYVSACTRLARYQAALDLLILEQSGATLTARDAERVTRDPEHGAAFVFDPAKRTLAIPAGSVAEDEKPLVLPW